MRKENLLHRTLFAFAILASCAVWAQEELQEVAVSAPRWDPRLESASSELDTLSSLPALAGNAADVLKHESSIYLRSYGPGLASTITRHGFSPSQGVVFWNGVPLNSPALGLTDLSTIPTNPGSQLILDPAANGSAFGSGYMGGGVHLYSNRPDTGWTFTSYSDYQSIGLWRENASVSFANSSTYHQAALSHVSGALDFDYIDLYGSQRARLGAGQRLQNFTYTGGMESSRSQWNWGFWGQILDRGIPRSISESYTEGARQLDDATRSFLSYSYSTEKSLFRAQVSHTWEDQRYISNVVSDTNIAQAVYTDLLYKKQLSDKWHIRATLHHAYQYVRGTSKDSSGVHRLGGAVHVTYSPSEFLKLNGGARADYQRAFAPLVPFLSASTSWADWTLTAQYNAHYRFPTLNDLYWNPGGNPDLLPERGNALRLTVAKVIQRGSSRYQFEGYVYANTTNEYILWVPTGAYFEPRNVRSVQSSGGRMSARWDARWATVRTGLSASYSFTKSIVQESSRPNDPALGNQLIYTPQHKANGQFDVLWSGLQFWNRINYLGTVFTTTDNNMNYALNPFATWDFGLSYSLPWKKFFFDAGLGVMNALDVDYAYQRFYPMPGRYYQISITIEFQHQ